MGNEKVNNSIPTFAFIGHPNVGKTSVFSSISEDDGCEIGGASGTTVKNRIETVKINRKPVYQLIDTPGFENDQDLLEWIETNHVQGQKSNHGQGRKSAKNMALEFSNMEGFTSDVEILNILSENVLVVYVVDDSQPVRQVDLNELDILNALSLKRIAVVTTHCENEQFKNKWKSILKERNIPSTGFNALKATFADRKQLLKEMAREYDKNSSHGRAVTSKTMADSIQIIETDWNERRVDSSIAIAEVLNDLAVYKQKKEIKLNPTEKEMKGEETDSIEIAREKVKCSVEKAKFTINELYNHKRLIGPRMRLDIKPDDVDMSDKCHLLTRHIPKWCGNKRVINLSFRSGCSIPLIVLDELLDYFYLVISRSHACRDEILNYQQKVSEQFIDDDSDQLRAKLKEMLFSKSNKNSTVELQKWIDGKLEKICTKVK